MKTRIDELNTQINKLKFHNACLLYLLGELRDNKKLKFPTMQEVCVLFDLSSDELKVILKNIQKFDDVNQFMNDTLTHLDEKISQDALFFIIKGIKNSINGSLKKTCKILLKHKKSKNQR